MTFMKQMNGMVAELNSTRCNFIRCIKPNYQMEVRSSTQLGLASPSP